MRLRVVQRRGEVRLVHGVRHHLPGPGNQEQDGERGSGRSQAGENRSVVELHDDPFVASKDVSAERKRQKC